MGSGTTQHNDHKEDKELPHCSNVWKETIQSSPSGFLSCLPNPNIIYHNLSISGIPTQQTLFTLLHLPSHQTFRLAHTCGEQGQPAASLRLRLRNSRANVGVQRSADCIQRLVMMMLMIAMTMMKTTMMMSMSMIQRFVAIHGEFEILDEFSASKDKNRHPCSLHSNPRSTPWTGAKTCSIHGEKDTTIFKSSWKPLGAGVMIFLFSWHYKWFY